MINYHSINDNTKWLQFYKRSVPGEKNTWEEGTIVTIR